MMTIYIIFDSESVCNVVGSAFDPLEALTAADGKLGGNMLPMGHQKPIFPSPFSGDYQSSFCFFALSPNICHTKYLLKSIF